MVLQVILTKNDGFNTLGNLDNSMSVDDWWRNKEWLYDQYWRKEKTLSQIANELGYSSRQTIGNEMGRQGIPTRQYSGSSLDGYIMSRRLKSWFYDQYWRHGKSMAEIGEENDVAMETVRSRMDILGIPRAEKGGRNTIILYRRGRQWLFREYWLNNKTCDKIDREQDVPVGTTRFVMAKMEPEILRRPSGPQPNDVISRKMSGGYIFLYDSGNDKVLEHRLAAVAEYGYDAVVGKVIHHTNEIPWLNVPIFDADVPELETTNLKPMDVITHARAH